MTVRRVFDKQLNELHKKLLAMGLLVDEAIHQAVKSLVEKDYELATSVIAGDEVINNMEMNIEKLSFELIALQQPVGTDLRKIITTLKVATDLERMADHAVSIAKAAIHLRNGNYAKPLIDIPEMASIVQKMVHESLDAYIALDVTIALEVATTDDQVDNYFYRIYEELIDLMVRDSKHIHQATHLLFVAQHLERIGDYVTNICEWVVYLENGKLVELN